MKRVEHKVELKDYNAMTDGIFDQPINGELKAYENIWKIVSGQGDNYTTGCLLDYSYFKKKILDDCNRFK